MEPFPLPTKTLYAELMDQLALLEAQELLGSGSGSLVTKIVKGETYLYFQHSHPGGSRPLQVYLGKKNPELEQLSRNLQKKREDGTRHREHVRLLCAQIRSGGGLVTDTASARVIQAFAEAGFFRLGGVLVGTHAFTVFGNLLGRRWDHAALKTHVDLAAEKTLKIGVPALQTSIPQVLEGLEMGFLPIPSLNPKHPSTSFTVRGSSLRVDLLTPLVGPPKTKPVYIPRFQAAAQPLRFMDYLIENPVKGALIDAGGILVHVPQPARFALHKLIVSGERSSVWQTKSDKDLHQAVQILSFLTEEFPEEIHAAWKALSSRGAGWSKRLLSSLQKMGKINQGLSADLKRDFFTPKTPSLRSLQ